MAKLERWVVVLIALHSLVVGLVLIFAAGPIYRWAGWPEITPMFFPRQGGAFHLVLAIGYLLEFFRHGTVQLLVTAKTIAAVFLLGSFVAGESAWAVPGCGIADGAMGIVAWYLHRRVQRQPTPVSTVTG